MASIFEAKIPHVALQNRHGTLQLANVDLQALHIAVQALHAALKTADIGLQTLDIAPHAVQIALHALHVPLQLTNVEPQLPDRHLQRGIPQAGLLLEVVDPLLECHARGLDRFDRRAILRAHLFENDLPGRP